VELAVKEVKSDAKSGEMKLTEDQSAPNSARHLQTDPVAAAPQITEEEP